MTCQACKHEFCWLCLGDFTPDHFNPRQLTSCAGRMFTTEDQESLCSVFIKNLLTIIIILFVPFIFIILFIFIIPYVLFFQAYAKIRIRTRQINQMHVHDNRFQKRDLKAALDQIGRCKLFGWSIISIFVSPITFIVFCLPFAIILFIWLILIIVMIWKMITILFSLCKGRYRNNR